MDPLRDLLRTARERSAAADLDGAVKLYHEILLLEQFLLVCAGRGKGDWLKRGTSGACPSFPAVVRSIRNRSRAES